MPGAVFFADVEDDSALRLSISNHTRGDVGRGTGPPARGGRGMAGPRGRSRDDDRRGAALPGREQTRARYPDETGYVERDGVSVFWERYGDGEPTVLFLPTWSIIHSRCWKAQIPYFARHFRALTFDGRGNGRSDRPPRPRGICTVGVRRPTRSL